MLFCTLQLKILRLLECFSKKNLWIDGSRCLYLLKNSIKDCSLDFSTCRSLQETGMAANETQINSMVLAATVVTTEGIAISSVAEPIVLVFKHLVSPLVCSDCYESIFIILCYFYVISINTY